VLFRVAGCGSFAFPAPNIDGSYFFGWQLWRALDDWTDINDQFVMTF